jgi:drug/metabolite transporter (DMT)-like permease
MLRHGQRLAAAGVLVVLLGFVGLSLGSTMAKATHAPGSVVAFWRLLIGGVLWHLVVALRGARTGRPRHVSGEAWRLATLPGIAFGLNICLFFSGVDRTPIAHAEFISALTPLVLVPLSAVTLRERVPRASIVAGLCALAGVSLILSRAPSGSTSYLGDLLVAGAMATWIAYLLGSKTARSRTGAFDFMAAMSVIACATTLPLALLAAGSPGGLVDLTAQGWILCAALAIVTGMLAHGLIAWSQGRVALGTISLVQLVQPGLGALWGALFLSEAVAPVQLVGIAVVLVSVGAIVRSSASRPQPPGRLPAPVRVQRSRVSPSPSPACSLRSSSSS